MAIRLKGRKALPNAPCPCESGLKFKHCHDDPAKKAACEVIVREHMYHLIVAEKIKRGLVCQHGVKTGDVCVDCMGPQELDLEGEDDDNKRV